MPNDRKSCVTRLAHAALVIAVLPLRGIAQTHSGSALPSYHSSPASSAPMRAPAPPPASSAPTTTVPARSLAGIPRGFRVDALTKRREQPAQPASTSPLPSSSGSRDVGRDGGVGRSRTAQNDKNSPPRSQPSTDEAWDRLKQTNDDIRETTIQSLERQSEQQGKTVRQFEEKQAAAKLETEEFNVGQREALKRRNEQIDEAVHNFNYDFHTGLTEGREEQARRDQEHQERFKQMEEDRIYREQELIDRKSQAGIDQGGESLEPEAPQGEHLPDPPGKADQGMPDAGAPPEDRATISDPDGWVNLRSGPSVRSEVLYRIENGQSVEVVDVEGDWCRVRTSRGTGFVHRDRLVPEGPPL